jgi:hypothetical protein
VYLVPQPTGFPVLTNVCPGTPEDVDFNNFIPPEIRYFINEIGWTITYTLNGEVVNMPVKAGLSNVGNTAYSYTINDGSGPFKGKWSEIQSSAYSCPENSAYLTHTVRIREDEEYTIPNKSISFCTDVLKLVPETATVFNTNLFGYLGSSAPGGIWSVEKYDGLNESNLGVDPTTGDAFINIGVIDRLQIGDTIIFKYSYKDCMEQDTFTLLTFYFDNTAFKNTFGEDNEQEVCRNLMSGVVELSSIFGFTAPLTSGIWFHKASEDNFEEMLYGAVALDTLKSGSLYTFRYDVNRAIDDMCMAENSSTLFSIRLHDLEVSNAEAKICKNLFTSTDGVTIDLSRYVPGLNNIDRIDPNTVTWRDTLGNIISTANAKNYRLKARDGWEMPDTAYIIPFKYEIRSNCGPYTGNLSISVVDSIGADTERKVVICYTDDYAKHIDLFQILGIVGANGRFNLYEASDDQGREINPANISEIESSGIMNAFELYNKEHKMEKYIFRYQSGSEECVPRNMQITIIITRDIEKDSEFE